MQRRYPPGSITAALSLSLACLIYSPSGLAASPKAGDIVVQTGVVKAADGALPVPTFKVPGFSPHVRVD
ncbi:hypothetical protein [Pinirhizobacter sp.]|jgi:hypothetical protein|uniref:hypothetical protein n=1 Tax=Pinirhizobacter sp. TaxID=2950432 RepID=UPI002F412A47